MMRKNSVLSYLLSDHLGSTSIVTDASGNLISETRYKAWGETRYTSGTEQTKYTYTGQYSYTSDFGLMFYNARWYDPYLNRFTQPDSIVPDPANPQDWDRYSYARNNPLKYTDPTGHCAIDASMDDCYSSKNIERTQNLVKQARENPGKKAYGRYALNAIANLYGIQLSPTDHWEYEQAMIRMYGTGDKGPLGNNPLTDDEFYYGYNPANPVADAQYTADDYGVYITGVGFDYCQMKLSCIATIMTHEAVHSWTEYLIGGDIPENLKQNPELVSEIGSNAELFADTIGKKVFPIGSFQFDIHSSGINQTCAIRGQDCSHPQSYLENIFNVDLSSIADLVIR